MACSYDPRVMAGQPIGMFHCPECGEMVLAGMPHIPSGTSKMKSTVPIPKQFIFQVASNAENRPMYEETYIDEQLAIVREMILARLEKMKAETREAEDRATGPHEYFEED